MLVLKRFWRSLFDVRPGEYAVTLLMSLYLMLVLFAYYIVKPVSRALFLNNLDIDKLPWLYILVSTIGGVLAYLYTKVAVRSSLRLAINYATAFCVLILVLFWWLIRYQSIGVIYAFNIWVSLFSVILVSQGWLVAANVFTSRQAKRLYGMVGVGSVLGAAFGGQFTASMVYYIGNTNLVLASAGMVVLSYFAYRGALKASGKTLGGAKAAEDTEDLRFAEIIGAIRKLRHLQVIVAITMITFMVDVMIEFQFSAYAQKAYSGHDLTAFLGNFYGFWLNLVTFGLQLFLTSFVVSRFGIGGTLQIMPVCIAAASIASLISPSLLSTAAARLTEASTRYSFNKTGMELLYLPLPLELRNRTKAFVDVFVDRFSRGLGGMILLLLPLDPRHFSIVVLALSGVWVVLSIAAQRQYVATVRERFEHRRLDFENARIQVSDRATLALLEQTTRTGTPRQASYALDLLSQAPGYRLDPLLLEMVASPHVRLRGKIFEIARKLRTAGLESAALAEIRKSRTPDGSPAVREAVLYVVALSGEPVTLARRLLDHANPEVSSNTVAALGEQPDVARELMHHDWLRATSVDTAPSRRALAAQAIGVRGDSGTEALFTLLNDKDPLVVAQAIRTVGVLKNREYLPAIIRFLSSPRLRGLTIDALAEFGAGIVGTLQDLLTDTAEPLTVRRYLPRVLQRIPDQRSVDALAGALSIPDLSLRIAILKALNKLRISNPELNYQANGFASQVLDEAKYYFELHSALAPLRKYEAPTPAASLLVRTLEYRLRTTLERLFRLLGLHYPPREMHAAYRALQGRTTDDFTAALDFLDNVLERELKRVLLPLLDEDAVLPDHARELFRIEPKDAQSALRSLIHSGDPWLAACAMSAAAELRLTELVMDIRDAARSGGRDLAVVAQAAEAVLV